MLANDWRHKIETLEQQVETVRAAAAHSTQRPEGLQEALEILQTSMEELRMIEEELHQQYETTAVAHQTTEAVHQRYRELFDFAPDGYLVTDSQGIIQEANRAAAALLAIRQEPLVGKPLAIFVAPEERPAFRTQLAVLTRVEHLRDWEVHLQPREGEPFAAALTVAAMHDLQGTRVGLLWLLRDITARQQAEAVLRNSEARQRAILQTAVDGIITIDERGIVESVNPAAERLFGYSADEVIGHNISMLMPSPYREAHDGYIARYLQTGEAHIIGIGREVRGQRRDGTTFPIALAVSEVRLDDRRLFTGIVHDLSARVQAEEALTRLSRQQQLILEAAGEGIYGVDRQGRVTFINPAAAQMLGWEVDALLGQVIHDRIHYRRADGTPLPWEACPLHSAFQTGEAYQIREDVFWRQDGTSFLVEYTATPMRERGKVIGAVVLFRDITAHIRAGQEMQRADRLALVGQLASGLAHEIGTPLNIIGGNAEFLGMQLRDQGVETAELDAIIEQTERITRLIERLLTFARAKDEPMAPVALHDPLTHALRLLETRFQREAITVTVDVPAELPLVWGAADQLAQVFVNVLVNAWHAMPGGGSVTIAAQLTATRQVRIVVRDSGVGMDSATLARVFEPFYTTKGDRGTGLGLAICKQIIERHGGTICLESTPGGGTTITIDLLPAAAQG